MANTKVTGDVIANGTISTVHLADDAITAAKLDSTATGITFADLTVDTDTLYVDAANNRVGIATLSPVSALHINSSEGARITGITSSANAALYIPTGGILGDNGSDFFEIRNGGDSSSEMRVSSRGFVSIYTSGAGDLGTGSEKMRIDSSGNVGIGTDSPYSNGLTIQGNSDDYSLTIAQGNASNAGYGFKSDTSGHFSLARYASGSFGSPALFVQLNTNNIGIGTTSPSYKLEVNGGTALVGGGFYVSSDQSIVTSSTYTFRDGVYINNPNSSSAAVSSNSVMSIGAMAGNSVNTSLITTGAVGIGTSSPSQKLHVDGIIYSVSSGTDGGQIRLANSGGGSNWYWAARTTGLNLGELGAADGRIFIANGGNVGIGITSPAQKLHIKNAPNNTVCYLEDTTGYALVQLGNSGGSLYFGIDNSAGTGFLIGSGYSRHIYSTGTNDFHISTNASPRITINGSSGNVGIGHTTPQFGLTLAQGAGDGSRIGWEDGANNKRASIICSSSTDALQFHTGTSDTERMRITSGGYTEIKATGGSSRLYLEGTSGTHFLTGTSGGDFGIYNDTASSYRMFINSSGNVGIGTTSPQSKLHVNGGGINLEQGGQLTERTTGIESSAAQNTWYTVHTFNQYELTLFFLLVGFEDDLGDGNNRTAVFVDSGSSSYGSGFAPTRLSGSTSIEAQRSGQALQIRFTHTAGGSNRQLRWSLITVTGN